MRGEALEKFGQWPDSDVNYHEAWEWLIQQNERPYQTSKKILWKLINFPKLERPSGFLIEKLCTTSEGVVRQLRAMNYPIEHYDMFLVHCIHDKLDAETSKDWEIQRQSETPTFKQMIEFLQLRGRALSSATYFERKGNNDNRKRHSNDDRHFDHKRQKASTSSDKSKKTDEKTKCKICNNGVHWPNQ